VLPAGCAAGFAYGIVMDRQGWFFAASRVMGRVFTRYVAHIFLLVVFTAQVGLSAARLDASLYLDEQHLDPFAAEPWRALLEALLLRYQPSFLNILPLHIVVLALGARCVDVVIMGAQFSRFPRANADVDRYRDALRLLASRGEAGFFPRFDIMRAWAEAGTVDVERAPRASRTAEIDKLNDCLARALGAFILDGAQEARR